MADPCPCWFNHFNHTIENQHCWCIENHRCPDCEHHPKTQGHHPDCPNKETK